MTIASKIGWIIDKTRPADPSPNDGDAQPETGVRFERRFGVRLPGRRYFIDIRIGRERRAAERLADEGQARLPLATLISCGFGSLFLMVFGAACFAYLLKSLVGINLFDRDSVLHPLYVAVFG